MLITNYKQCIKHLRLADSSNTTLLSYNCNINFCYGKLLYIWPLLALSITTCGLSRYFVFMCHASLFFVYEGSSYPCDHISQCLVVEYWYSFSQLSISLTRFCKISRTVQEIFIIVILFNTTKNRILFMVNL